MKVSIPSLRSFLRHDLAKNSFYGENQNERNFYQSITFGISEATA